MVYGNRLSMLSTKWCGRAKRESRRQKTISNNDELVPRGGRFFGEGHWLYVYEVEARAKRCAMPGS